MLQIFFYHDQLFNLFQTVSQQVFVQLCFWAAAVWDAIKQTVLPLMLS